MATISNKKADEVPWYHVCDRCNAKWFDPLQSAHCPRCGARCRSRERINPPWLNANRANDVSQARSISVSR
jgi:hypothetical protein